MNRSYSKIRHIRESNILLENRRDASLITEETVIKKVPIYNNDRSKVTKYINLLKFKNIELERENNAPSFNISYQIDGDKYFHSKTYICGGGGIMCENIYCKSGEKYTLDTETTNWIESTYCKTTPGQPQNNQPVQNVVQPQGNKPLQNVVQPNKTAQRLPSF
jgi:hypothetical protein